eukprot:7053020-Karenia_brevis.AAC.1
MRKAKTTGCNCCGARCANSGAGLHVGGPRDGTLGSAGLWRGNALELALAGVLSSWMLATFDPQAIIDKRSRCVELGS